jgi:ribosome-binding protein aMBF1 (putative translation factor)
MERIGELEFYTLDEVKDEFIGAKGTKERTDFDKSVDDAVNAYYVGEAIKKARQNQNLTQEQLGEKIGVKRSQISKMEHGQCLTFLSLSRVFRALGVETASLDLGHIGRVPLWGCD